MRLNVAFVAQVCVMCCLVAGLAFGVDSLVVLGLVGTMGVGAYMALVLFRLTDRNDENE